MASSDVGSLLVAARAEAAENAVTVLNDILEELAADNSRDTAAAGKMGVRTQLMFCLMRLRNTVQQKASPLETNTRWDEAMIAARQYDTARNL